MAAPTNSGESDIATEEIFSDLSPLPSPGWSPLRLTLSPLRLTLSPLRLTLSPPRPLLPSSSSMFMQYQGCNQSMDNPPQNQEHNDIVDPAPHLVGDSSLLQQQLPENWSEASDWRPRGGRIMTMNNQGFEESNIGFEEESEEMMTMTCFNFSPSSSMPNVFFVSDEQENKSLGLSCQHILEDKSGALHVLNGGQGKDIVQLLLEDDVSAYLNNKLVDLDQVARAAGVLREELTSLWRNIEGVKFEEREVTIRRINWLEQHDENMVDQPFFKAVGVVQQLIQNRDGKLDVILGGGVFMVNGLERRNGQGPPTTPETLLICQAKHCIRVWLGNGGQWVIETRSRRNRLNIGSFTTVEDAISAYDVVIRWSGWMDLTSFPRLIEKENRSKLPPQLPLTAQELNPVEAVGTGSEGTRDCMMVDQARLNSGCLGKRKTREKNPRRERRSKKTNGVRIAIPLEDNLQTKGMRLKDAANHLKVTIPELKSSCQDYGIQSWPPLNKHKLTKEKSPVGERVSRSAQLNSDTLLSDQALAATIGTNSVVVKEIVAPLFLPTAQLENLDEDFGNGVEAVGMGSERIGESETEDGQLNSKYLGKGKRKKMTPRGERRNKKTNGVRMTKEMLLKDAAKHLKVIKPKLKTASRDYGIQRWPPRHKQDLIRQSYPNETSVIVDEEGISQLNYDTLPSDQSLAATVDTNSGVVIKIHPPQFLPKARQENPNEDFGNYEVEVVGMGVEGTREGEMEEDEDFGNYEVEAVGMGVEGTGEGEMECQLNSGCLGKGKSNVETPRGDRGNKKTNGVKIAISLEDILQAERMYHEETGKQMSLADAAKKFKVTIAELKSSCQEYGIQICSPRNEHKLIMQPLPDETPAVVDQEVISQLTSHNVPSDQPFMATVDTNSVIEKEVPLTQFLPTAQQENLNAGFGNDEAEAIGMGGEKTREGVIEEARLNSGCLKNQGKRKVNTPGGDERGNNRTTRVRIAIPKEDILQTKGMHLKDVANHLGDEDFGNVEAEAVGMGSGGTRQSDMEEDQLNSRYLEKEKMKEMTPGVERRNKKNAISLKDIFRCKEMPQKVAAKHLKVGLSTLKRACRGHGIPSWPPCGEHNQSRPNKSPAVVDKELLPSNQVSATIGTESVTVKAKFGTVTLKFQLSWPWRMVELKQQVEKRLRHEAENYYICYKDQDNDVDLLIACDEDLQDHISHSSLPGTNSIEVFLKPK